MELSPSQIPPLIRAEEVIIYNNLAASAFVFWEHIITFRQEEVDFMWRSKWNFVALLFVVIRYTNLSIRIFQLVVFTNVLGILHPTPSMCKSWVWYEAIPGHAVVLGVEVVLTMRVVAFYGRTKAVLATLITLFVIAHAASIGILLYTVPKFVVIPNPLPPNLHVSVCLVVQAPKLFVNYWVPGLALETILFILLIAKFIYTNQGKASRPRVIVVFVRDGAWAFAVIFAVMLWAALAFHLSPAKGDIALTWVLSTVGICGSRLILNLRDAAKKTRELPENPIELYSVPRQDTPIIPGYGGYYATDQSISKQDFAFA